MTLPPWLRRHRGTTVIGMAVLTVLVALTVVTAGSAGRGEPLDPANPGASGARAVAQVLARHGVRLSVVRRAAQLRRAQVDAGTTLLVTSADHLGRATAGQVGRRTASAGAVVLAAPGPTLVRALRLPVAAAQPALGRAGAGCDDPLLADLTLDVGRSAGYRARGGSVTECFAGSADRAGALVVRVDRGPPVYAVGGTGLFTNDRVDRADNAAAALRLLGQRGRLVWYVPDRRDVVAGDAGSLAAQLPRGLFPALWLLVAAVLATMVWRGRRLGPLVVEPLPVVVKAVESTQGRGRLYRRVRDASHAAALLRAATVRRLSSRLRLAPGSDLRALVAAVTRMTGTEPEAVHEVLLGRRVADDAALVRLAADLTALEKEVHRA